MLKIIDRNCLISIVGGVRCSCILIYKAGSLIPIPIQSILGEKRCKKVCCPSGFDHASRYMFEDQLYKCFANQTDFNLTQAIPPDEECTRLIEKTKVHSELMNELNIINSALYAAMWAK